MRRLMLAAFAVFALSRVPEAVAAEPEAVQITHRGLRLNGNLALAEGKKVTDGLVLITHGTLAHNGMEVIRVMQAGLTERGVNSLAITLSLGRDDRRGMYDCAAPHRHRHMDALDEIGAWLGWAKAQGASRLVLMGHSRGGAQTALFAAERPDPAVSRVVLLAPATHDAAADASQYRSRHGRPLSEPLERASSLMAAGKGEEAMVDTGFLYCPATTVSAAAFVGYYRPDPRLGVVDPLGRITVPTLVIAAADDEVVKGLPEIVAPLVDGVKVKLLTVSTADHDFRDLAAEDAADAIAAFLAE